MNILDSLKKYFYKNGSSEASSSARIPLLTATGEPKGSDTMANIASVLGVEIPKSLGVIDSAKRDEVSKIDYTAYLYTANSPIGIEGFLMTIGTDHFHNGGNIQYFTTYTGAKIITRTYNFDSETWTNWKEISLDVPSFYKSYQDLGSLATALGVRHEKYQGSLYDLGQSLNVYQPDIRAYSGSCPDAPANGQDGLIITGVTNVTSGNINFFVQLATTDTNVYFRFYHAGQQTFLLDWTALIQ